MNSSVEPFARVRLLRGRAVLRGFAVHDFPVITTLSGIEPLTFSFLVERFIKGRQMVSSRQQEAYILCDWINYLVASGLSIDVADPFSYYQWVSLPLEKGLINRARAHRKIAVVWEFYHYLVLSERARPAVRSFFEQISECKVSNDNFIVWSRKAELARGHSSRPTYVPSVGEVQRVIEMASTQETAFLRERNFLVCQCESRMGLRAMGVSALRTSDLESCLREEQILTKGERLTHLVNNSGRQIEIRSIIKDLEKSGRTIFSLSITEKGRRTRQVKLPIDLARQLVNHVWGRRAALIKARRVPARDQSETVFLSSRTGLPMRVGTVKDLVKLAFLQADVRGSGHSLRAFYLTEEACQMIREAMKLYGPNFSMDDIFDRLADLAGHSHKRTLNRYLSVARLRAAALEALEAHENRHSIH